MKPALRSLLMLPLLAAALALPAQTHPRTLTVSPGKTLTLNLPSGLDISVAATGIRRVRFFAQSPDGRVFATSMYNLADNTRGAVYILDRYDAATHRFTRITPYLTGLRNPNNVAFWTDPAGQSWLYLPLTDKLVRYLYKPGDMRPSGPAQTLLRFPDYGLNYKYGGWHLTRTVAIATLHGATHVYIAAGSSCNYCQEREAARAAVIRINPDGTQPLLVAQGLRNAVDLRFVPGIDGGALFATDMGDDHLGDKLPEDTFFELDSNDHPGPIANVRHPSPSQPGVMQSQIIIPPPNYGWPTCYFANGKPVHDTTPLPSMPAPGNPDTESERPRNAGHELSVYGAQTSNIATAGTNLAAGGGRKEGADPDAFLGTAPKPLTSCEHVPPAYTTFAAHSSPLGLAYFDASNPLLAGHFLVALHGAGHPSIGTGYRIVSFTPEDRTPRDWATGFLTRGPNGRPVVHGRPCGFLQLGPDRFLLSDDYLGAVYLVEPASNAHPHPVH